MSLALFGAFLGAVGVCDLLRATRDRISPARQAVLIAVGVALLAVFLLWAGESRSDSFLVGVALSGALAAWVVGSSRALGSREDGVGSPLWRGVAFAGFGGGALVSLLAADVLPDWLLWPTWMQSTIFGHWPVADVVVSGGAVLLQLSTGNLLVRLTLESVGMRPAVDGRALHGGRFLGPLERIFILGLGHMGELVAASIVLAAKCVVRFPELQAAAKSGDRTAAEHFLVGSFMSWLIAFAGVTLVYLA